MRPQVKKLTDEKVSRKGLSRTQVNFEDSTEMTADVERLVAETERLWARVEKAKARIPFRDLQLVWAKVSFSSTTFHFCFHP